MFSHSTILPIELITIEDDGLHLIVKASINTKICKMLIDTGASRTVFDQTRILQFVDATEFEKHDKLSTGLGTDSMPTSSTILENFTIGEILVPDFKAVLLDLSHVNSSYEKMGYDPIDGVLGSDILNKLKAIIDYPKLMLKLKRLK